TRRAPDLADQHSYRAVPAGYYQPCPGHFRIGASTWQAAPPSTFGSGGIVLFAGDEAGRGFFLGRFNYGLHRAARFVHRARVGNGSDPGWLKPGPNKNSGRRTKDYCAGYSGCAGLLCLHLETMGTIDNELVAEPIQQALDQVALAGLFLL